MRRILYLGAAIWQKIGAKIGNLEILPSDLRVIWRLRMTVQPLASRISTAGRPALSETVTMATRHS